MAEIQYGFTYFKDILPQQQFTLLVDEVSTQSKHPKSVSEIEPNYEDHRFYNDIGNNKWERWDFPFKTLLNLWRYGILFIQTKKANVGLQFTKLFKVIIPLGLKKSTVIKHTCSILHSTWKWLRFSLNTTVTTTMINSGISPHTQWEQKKTYTQRGRECMQS